MHTCHRWVLQHFEDLLLEQVSAIPRLLQDPLCREPHKRHDLYIKLQR